jgi:hypothetical protein
MVATASSETTTTSSDTMETKVTLGDGIARSRLSGTSRKPARGSVEHWSRVPVIGSATTVLEGSNGCRPSRRC